MAGSTNIRKRTSVLVRKDVGFLASSSEIRKFLVCGRDLFIWDERNENVDEHRSFSLLFLLLPPEYYAPPSALL